VILFLRILFVPRSFVSIGSSFVILSNESGDNYSVQKKKRIVKAIVYKTKTNWVIYI
jgi:hypothetical protein